MNNTTQLSNTSTAILKMAYDANFHEIEKLVIDQETLTTTIKEITNLRNKTINPQIKNVLDDCLVILNKMIDTVRYNPKEEMFEDIIYHYDI